jgi:acyl carrier protein
MSIRENISNYITGELLNGETVAHDDNLLGEGVIDSLGMLRLVAFLEESYEVQVPPEHFTIENFRTIESIETYLTRLLNGDR